MSFLKVEDFELVFATAILPASAPPHSISMHFRLEVGVELEVWKVSSTSSGPILSLGFPSFTWLQLHTSVSPAPSLVPSSTEPPCLKLPSQPNLLCLYPLFLKVSSQNTRLIKSISPSPSTESIKETDKKPTTPCRPTKA